MTDQISPITIRILGKEYRIVCNEDEQDQLLASAHYLDRKMREIRDTGRVIGTERIAIMAALHIAHELTLAQNENNFLTAKLADHITHIQGKIDSALDSN